MSTVLSERSLYALASIFLHELDVLRINEEYKILLANEGFDVWFGNSRGNKRIVVNILNPLCKVAVVKALLNSFFLVI